MVRVPAAFVPWWRGVMASVRALTDDTAVMAAGAHHVLLRGPDLVDRVWAVAPDGGHHIVKVAFGANIGADVELVTVGGSVATYATDADHPAVPFWPLLLKNIAFSQSDITSVPCTLLRSERRWPAALGGQGGHRWAT